MEGELGELEKVPAQSISNGAMPEPSSVHASSRVACAGQRVESVECEVVQWLSVESANLSPPSPMAAARRRVGQTKVGASPLLRTVGGQPHAQAHDHDDAQAHAHSELGIWDDPLSSGDEQHSAPPQPSKPSPRPTRKRKAHVPPPGAALRVPRPGQFEQSRAASFDFGLLTATAPRGRKVDYSSKKKTTNIHARPPNKTWAKPARLHGSKTHTWDVKPDADADADDDLDNISMLSDPLDDDQLADLKALADMPESRVAPRKKPARLTGSTLEASAQARPQPTPQAQTSSTDAAAASLPNASAPHAAMENIDSYMRELPAVAAEGTECSICHEPVDQAAYWDFWKGRKKTIKNQALYCHTHKKAAAQRDFDAERFPAIDWAAIPDRIKKHRMALHKILTGDAPSTYRTRYEPLALTGKAATVPSKRADLSPAKQAELASNALDDPAIYPGYYGPRGRRQITESVMALLSNEIKRCRDAVVQTSGPATFVQAVLVPEVAVRLIMDDCHCDWDAAEDVRERTYDMGVLLNDEIDDCLDLVPDSDEHDHANDYL